MGGGVEPSIYNIVIKEKVRKKCFWVGLFLGEILLCMAGLRYFTKIVINLPKRSFTVNERLARFLGTHRQTDT